jgi:hypothetical protein
MSAREKLGIAQTLNVRSVPMTAIPSPVQAILDLFTTELEAVRFGDVDGKSLGGLAAEVHVAAEALASAEGLVADARSALQDRQDALLQHAQRALAYARVYAEADVALSARLDAIALPRATRRARPDASVPVLSADPPAPMRPRGRPRKTPLTEPTLPSLELVEAIAE